ncbi:MULTISPECIES: 1-acyl-sn-glycerol-3-phosphate acyltransferase [unclassified Anabaena]|uniref:lysophospholipid acyltransferase family protein n=1 Tax=unclassified Anabaena TaxID=2619674 RepID=UPI001447DB4A|nr:MULTISPECIES: 1-acyl-sn-glycerol-3-phosphate acyltransferase [unclassified Anabaena]MTJ09957.1 1-acyl-sn-glycerol-3-phosphate acyltransferase [Anabaena sp. UHCC 0204]MTJ53011.1 1-acyl-sn-glycerol-3-phosphate acyltransferase [Anabaena sp. UHCC 0253]
MIKSYSASTKRHSQTLNQPVNPLVAQSTSRVSPWLTPLAYLLGRYVVLPSFFGRIKIIGRENIPTRGPVILAPTHRSRWDSLVLPYATGRHVTGRDMRFMVTSNECQGLQGWFVRRMGGFPVNTERPAIATLRHTVELMQQGEMLVIYPEGNIYRDGQLHPLKPGIARLAVSAESSYPGLEVKVIPVGIQYSEPYPNWGTDVDIHIGEPIKVTDYINGNLKLEAKRLTADLTHKLKQLNHQESEISDRIFVEIHN